MFHLLVFVDGLKHASISNPSSTTCQVEATDPSAAATVQAIRAALEKVRIHFNFFTISFDHVMLPLTLACGDISELIVPFVWTQNVLKTLKDCVLSKVLYLRPTLLHLG